MRQKDNMIGTRIVVFTYNYARYRAEFGIKGPLLTEYNTAIRKALLSVDVLQRLLAF